MSHDDGVFLDCVREPSFRSRGCGKARRQTRLLFAVAFAAESVAQTLTGGGSV